LETSAFAAPIPADSEAWQALPLTTRRTVEDEARRGRPAPDVATALAAVGAGRAAARTASACVAFGVLMLMLVAVGCPVVNQGLPAADRLSKGATLVAVALPGLLLGLCGVVMGVRTGRRQRLAGPNLALATAQTPGPPRPDVRFGPRWPRAMMVLAAIVCSALVLLAVFYLHSGLALVFGLAIVVLSWIGPPDGPIRAARFDAAGIDLPTRSARLPWTSVGSVAIAPNGRLTIEICGPFE
jgi:hypothetical protein